MKKKKHDIVERGLQFAVVIVQLSSSLPKNAAGFEIGKQLIRSGTSVGANVVEAQDAYSRKDFSHRMNVALKEARETKFWLTIILKAKLLPAKKVKWPLDEVEELIKILTVIVKKTKQK